VLKEVRAELIARYQIQLYQLIKQQVQFTEDITLLQTDISKGDKSLL
jgi:hypothetical protein